jgi:hypothetical protein
MVFRVGPAFSQHICRKVEGITFCLIADNNVQSSRHHEVKAKALSSPYLPVKFYQSVRYHSTKDKGIMLSLTAGNNVQFARNHNIKIATLSSPYLPIKFYQSARCYSTTTNNNVQSARYPNTKDRNPALNQ